ncbi:MAG: ATP phosphoribosyltransferase regulatory subunit, partial [Bdellovibrionaceae bacterium]|nr:ATP phosphoribosyltransferase regulatory subunit [Pseudobdellovibrionaceae bacterium]
YCHTVFEFTTDALGSQNAVLAGGRYDGLIKDLGGPQTPGVGWAFGIDRLAELLPDLPASAEPVAIVPLGDEAEQAAILLSEKLRAAGVKTDIGYSGNLAKRMKRADKIGARAAVIIGSNELATGAAQVKWLETGTQESIALSELAERLITPK